MTPTIRQPEGHTVVDSDQKQVLQKPGMIHGSGMQTSKTTEAVDQTVGHAQNNKVLPEQNSHTLLSRQTKSDTTSQGSAATTLGDRGPTNDNPRSASTHSSNTVTQEGADTANDFEARLRELGYTKMHGMTTQSGSLEQEEQAWWAAVKHSQAMSQAHHSAYSQQGQPPNAPPQPDAFSQNSHRGGNSQHTDFGAYISPYMQTLNYSPSMHRSNTQAPPPKLLSIQKPSPTPPKSKAMKGQAHKPNQPTKGEAEKDSGPQSNPKAPTNTSQVAQNVGKITSPSELPPIKVSPCRFNMSLKTTTENNFMGSLIT